MRSRRGHGYFSSPEALHGLYRTACPVCRSGEAEPCRAIGTRGTVAQGDFLLNPHWARIEEFNTAQYADVESSG